MIPLVKAALGASVRSSLFGRCGSPVSHFFVFPIFLHEIRQYSCSLGSCLVSSGHSVFNDIMFLPIGVGDTSGFSKPMWSVQLLRFFYSVSTIGSRKSQNAKDGVGGINFEEVSYKFLCISYLSCPSVFYSKKDLVNGSYLF